MTDSNFEIGRVIDLRDDMAITELEASEICHSCGLKHICRITDSGSRVVNAINSVNAKVGNKVLIEHDELNYLKLAFMEYGLPLVAFILSTLFSVHFITIKIFGIPKEISALIIGILFLIFVGFLLKEWSKKKIKQRFSIFKIKKVIIE